eukprot:312106-Pelagomonas_calceolata.AAC.2
MAGRPLRTQHKPKAPVVAKVWAAGVTAARVKIPDMPEPAIVCHVSGLLSNNACMQGWMAGHNDY